MVEPGRAAVDAISAALLELLDHINDLKRLPRTGWLYVGIERPESIADHTAGVALLALFLAERVNADLAGNGLERPLDIGLVVQQALLHDLAESLLTDLPKRSAALLGTEVKREAEAQALGQLLAASPNRERYLQLWADYTVADTAEARLVKDVDRLEMVHQALRYETAGHRGLDEFWSGHCWAYPASRQLFAALEQSRPAST